MYNSLTKGRGTAWPSDSYSQISTLLVTVSLVNFLGFLLSSFIAF